MTTTTANAVRVTQIIRASRERLFDAWTTPADLAQWWRMDEPGWAFAGASLDLRVGGAYRLGMTGPDGAPHVAVGVYREVQRPVRLAFTWDWEEPGNRVGETLVTVEFKTVSADATEVILTHERFPDALRASGHERGWTQLLTLLGRATQEHTP
ncbi:MAG TPA: SRPBCC family protein [Gemmatimonadaceae bacterium]|nr:SRPBCC family protein [Gemmatimonadaceae bacterium]